MQNTQHKTDAGTSAAQDASFIHHPRQAEYVARVAQLESEGLTTSDAQGVADAEFAESKPASTAARTPGPWRTGAITTRPGTIRMNILSDGAEFSPAFVAGDILPEDARLIAAAPELLKALKGAEAMLHESAKMFRASGMGSGHGRACEAHLIVIREAISKATSID